MRSKPLQSQMARAQPCLPHLVNLSGSDILLPAASKVAEVRAVHKWSNKARQGNGYLPLPAKGRCQGSLVKA